MDPTVGRFTTRDPGGLWFDALSLGNGYTYANNNPWSYMDPFGLAAGGNMKKPWWKKVTDAVGGAVSNVAGKIGDAIGDAWEVASYLPTGLGEVWDAVKGLFDGGSTADDVGAQTAGQVADAKRVGDQNRDRNMQFADPNYNGDYENPYNATGKSELNTAVKEAGVEIFKNAVIAGTMVETGAIGRGATVGRQAAPVAFRTFTRSNFRHNLSKLTGGIPANAQAHHVFPIAFVDDFNKAGINIHNPYFGAWWQTTAHQNAVYGYNARWRRFLDTTPSSEQILQFGRDIATDYGLDIHF